MLDDHFTFVIPGVDGLFALVLPKPTFITQHPVNPLVVDFALCFQPEVSLADRPFAVKKVALL